MLHMFCLSLPGHSSKTSLEDFPWSCNTDQNNPPRTRVPLSLASAQLQAHPPSYSHRLPAFHAPNTHILTLKFKVFPDRKVQIIFHILPHLLVKTPYFLEIDLLVLCLVSLPFRCLDEILSQDGLFCSFQMARLLLTNSQIPVLSQKRYKIIQ